MAVDWRKHITSDPKMHDGRPTVRGMRIEVSDVLDNLGGGMSIDELLDDFPELTKADIQACLIFAAEAGASIA
jgi:uncharacterized protein (DUF433 family)